MLLSTNTKLKKENILSFGLPAIKTCPFADKCKQWCYGSRGRYVFPIVKAAQEKRLNASKKSFFVDLINYELDIKKKPGIVRVHDSGDFYSLAYLKKWMIIASDNPEWHFYCYTKAVKWIKSICEGPPSNFTPIFSFGGTHDHLINRRHDRHAIPFLSLSAMKQAGYTNCSSSDLNAIDSQKIGLLYRGNKARFQPFAA